MDNAVLIQYALIVGGVGYSVVLHEGAHAVTAYWFGDNTARDLGRITLNPIPSIDPIGTIVMPILGIVSGLPLIAWAKPVPVDPTRFRHRIWGDVIVSMAGIVVNLLIALLFTFVLVFHTSASDLQKAVVNNLLATNLWLALFNLIPIPPLDGHHVAKYLLPREMRKNYQSLGFMGILVVYFVMCLPATGGILASGAKHISEYYEHFAKWVYHSIF